MKDLALVVADVLVLSWIYVRVAREEIRRAATATDDMWQRDVSWFSEQEKETAACDDAAAPKESSRSGLRPVRQENVTRALWN
jgi:hypothetical protein